MPPASPARTIATYSGANARGRRASASLSDVPCSTSASTERSDSRSTPSEARSIVTSSARRIGTPARISVENERKKASSARRDGAPRCSDRPTVRASSVSRSTAVTNSARVRRLASTASADGASIEPRTQLAGGVARGVAVQRGAHDALRSNARISLGRLGRRLRVGERDLAAHDELGEVRLERLHPGGAAGHDRVAQLVRLAFADQRAHRVGADQDLRGGAPAGAVVARNEAQRDDPRQHRGELRADLRVRVGGERVDDAVDGLRGVVGVQRREHEVAGLGGGERRGDRRAVAHLADDDHVGIGAQKAAQRLGVVAHVAADLAVRDERARRNVHVLDRIFDGDDVALARCG